MYSFPQCRGLAPLTGSITNPCKRRMRFSCGISSRSDYAKKFIEQFPPSKAQSTKIGCAFCIQKTPPYAGEVYSLTTPYSEERRRAASELAKKNTKDWGDKSNENSVLCVQYGYWFCWCCPADWLRSGILSWTVLSLLLLTLRSAQQLSLLLNPQRTY